MYIVCKKNVRKSNDTSNIQQGHFIYWGCDALEGPTTEIVYKWWTFYLVIPFLVHTIFLWGIKKKKHAIGVMVVFMTVKLSCGYPLLSFNSFRIKTFTAVSQNDENRMVWEKQSQLLRDWVDELSHAYIPDFVLLFAFTNKEMHMHHFSVICFNLLKLCP